MSFEFECERKFLLIGNTWRWLRPSERTCGTTDLTSRDKAFIRVRSKTGRQATLMVKSGNAELHRVQPQVPHSGAARS